MAQRLADAMSMEEDGKNLNTSYYWMQVARIGPDLVNIEDGRIQYGIHQAYENGNHVVYRSAMEAKAAKVNPQGELFIAPRALLKCLAWGACTETNSYLVFQNIKPIEASPMQFGYLNHSFSQRKHTEIVLDQTRRRMPRFESPIAPLRKEYRQRQESEALQGRQRQYVSTINNLRPRSRQALGGTTQLMATQTSRTEGYAMGATLQNAGQRLLTSA